MKACEKLLGLCPEILTAWNYRRETIEARTGDAATTSEGGDEGEGEGEGDWMVFVVGTAMKYLDARY